MRDTATSRLGPEARSAGFARLRSEEFDVCVIGGGVTGVGCALDAALRGLSVVLVEREDLASGTSSRSSKLIHGGLRYLAQGELGLVRESLSERSLMLHTLCPHLVRPVPFLVPLTRPRRDRIELGAGLWLYDLMASGTRNPLDRHRHVRHEESGRLAPALDPDAHRGAMLFWDAQVDDARHTLTVARTAAHHGAIILTRAALTGLERRGTTVTGAHVTDTLSGATHTISARSFVAATGVWTDEVDQLAGDTEVQIRAAKGSHLLVPGPLIDSSTGLLVSHGRTGLLVIPWGDHWLIGTTDHDHHGSLDDPMATGDEVDELLGRINAVLRRPLHRSDVTATYAGLRPLLSGGSGRTSDLARTHAVRSPAPALHTVAGGKYTTYRVMATDGIDATAAELGSLPPSLSHRRPLLGASGASINPEAIVERHGISMSQATHLLGRYGSLVDEVLAPSIRRPTLAEPLEGAPSYLAAEVVYAATHETASTLDDVMRRRTRITMEADDQGHAAAASVARLLGDELGWDDDERSAQLERFRADLVAERAAQAASI